MTCRDSPDSDSETDIAATPWPSRHVTAVMAGTEANDYWEELKAERWALTGWTAAHSAASDATIFQRDKRCGAVDEVAAVIRGRSKLDACQVRDLFRFVVFD